MRDLDTPPVPSVLARVRHLLPKYEGDPVTWTDLGCRFYESFPLEAEGSVGVFPGSFALLT